MDTGNSNLQKMIFHLITWFLTIFSVIFLSEIVLRISGRVAVHGLHTAPGQIFDKIPGIFEPGQDFIYRANPNLSFHILINSLGYRGAEIERRKKPGTTRILCIGDSTTFGDFVDDNETFPYKLQKLFEQKHEPVEVINGGVGGTTIIDQLYFLKRSMEINPDIVILTFFLNDIPELSKEEPLHISFEKNRRLKSSSFFGPLYALFRDTALFQLALKTKARYRLLFYQEAELKQRINLTMGTSGGEAELRMKYSQSLNEMYRYLQKKSVKFMVVILPSHHQIGERTEFSDLHDDRIEWVERLSREMGIPTVNFLNIFKEKNLTKEHFFLLPYDGHHSPLAYDIVANSVFASLKKVLAPRLLIY